MPDSKRRAVLACVFVLAGAYSLLNVVAGADLGYDAYPGGKEIVLRWSYAVVAFIVLSLASAVAAWRTRRRRAVDGLN